jgi:hypothetical protein
MTISEFGFNGFPYKVEREGEEGELVRRYFMRGNRGGTDGASLPLPWSMGGRPWRRAARRCKPGRRRLR